MGGVSRLGVKVNIRRLLFAGFLATGLLFPVASNDNARGQSDEQKDRAVRQKKPAQFYYVCPMHPDVNAESSGTCPKCKMSLVKKRKPKTPASSER
jgi:heavy metal-binding protein